MVVGSLMICDGASLLITEFQELYDVIGDTWGEDETSFMLPDLRGQFIRGFDNGRGIDADRVFGSDQAASSILIGGTGASGVQVGNMNADLFDTPNGTTVNTGFATRHTLKANVESKPVRPTNVALTKIIKY